MTVRSRRCGSVAATGLTGYFQAVDRFPFLDADRELELARRWIDQRDLGAAQVLVTSHMRLVIKIARGFQGYGLPISELISEGNIGLIQAVQRFDPNRGFRVATYATAWIRATIGAYILRSWSLVKIGTTRAQKKLFFNLNRMKHQYGVRDDGDLAPEIVAGIAACLNVPEAEVTAMNRRLAGPDHSLNTPLVAEGDSEWQEFLADDAESQETHLASREESALRRIMLREAMKTLTERERYILTERRLRERPTRLEVLVGKLGISSERVRQIEVAAVRNLAQSVAKLGSATAAPIPAPLAGTAGSTRLNLELPDDRLPAGQIKTPPLLAAINCCAGIRARRPAITPNTGA